MKIGILGPRATTAEGRVLLTPRQAGVLDPYGVTVLVERGVGVAAGFDDGDYAAEGATVLSRREEIIGQADLLLAVSRPDPAEISGLRRGSTVLGFFHVDEDHPFVEAAVARGISVIALEKVRADDGHHPFRERMAEIAGAVSAQLAGRLLLSPPGRGVLLGGVTGVPPADVVVIGAGYLGRSAARAFSGAGASVMVLDRDLQALDALEREGLRRVRTMLAGPAEISDASTWADVLIGAVRVPNGPPPKLLSAVNGRPGAVWLDLSVDDGGCFEESRPVWRAEDAYEIEGVVCCPVPNLASWAARTASRIGSALLAPVLLRAAEAGQFDLSKEAWLSTGSLG